MKNKRIETVPLKDWEKLYQAAQKFFDEACWEYMSDSDIFGVKDPISGEINFCCVMGLAGEHFALAAYLGVEGLDGYLKIAIGEFFGGQIEALNHQKCLMASFEDAEELEKSDKEIIKQLGLKFHGKNSWPLFRDFLPGFLPWFLGANQVKTLTAALEQAVEVAKIFKENRKSLSSPDGKLFLTRELIASGQWTNAWRELPLKKEKDFIVLDEMIEKEKSRCQKIKQSTNSCGEIWEIDYSLAPMPVAKEKSDRPYFPKTLLCADQKSFLVLGVNLIQTVDNKEARNFLLNTIEKTKTKPLSLQVKKPDLYTAMLSVAALLNIELVLVKKLPALNEVQKYLKNFPRLPE